MKKNFERKRNNNRTQQSIFMVLKRGRRAGKKKNTVLENLIKPYNFAKVGWNILTKTSDSAIFYEMSLRQI